jgi:hypothetical protein
VVKLFGDFERFPYVKAMSKNWSKSIPERMSMLRSNGVTIEKFFEHERTVTFKIASRTSGVSFVCNHIGIDADVCQGQTFWNDEGITNRGRGVDEEAERKPNSNSTLIMQE